MKTNLLDANSTALSLASRRAGEACARKLFNARGNHSEVHLNEYELALACAAAAEVAVQMATKEAA